MRTQRAAILLLGSDYRAALPEFDGQRDHPGPRAVPTSNEEPANFWYFNNGITVLCDMVEKAEQSMLAPQQRPLTLTLHNASVVNGEQTVRSVAEAVAADATAAEE
ncbi:AIPR family protein [Streptomyces niveiscabiei]|uniref:AIPR family protein n=1 Tax=Streptomyces niveiscabiei TaxID=164115 RepID=A0ABW9HYT0_9ACTN